MKHVTIVVPNGYADLSSITGTLEIFNRANEYWQKIGNKSMIEVRIAGFVTELKLDVGLFSVFPVNIKEIEHRNPLLSFSKRKRTMVMNWSARHKHISKKI
jgi:hypothetical protein